MTRVVCLGRPAVDYTLTGNHELFNLVSNEHRFCSPEEFRGVAAQYEPHPSPGGSMGNTAYCLGKLGIPTSYIGLTGDDQAGDIFRHAMAESGVRMPPQRAGITKRILVILNEAGERAFLGTEDQLLLTEHDVVELFPQFAADADFALAENYSFKTQPEAAIKFLELAKQADKRTIMTLPNQHIMANHLDSLKTAAEYVDIIYGNRAEVDAWLELTGQAENDILQTLDKDGAIYRYAATGEEVFVPAQPVTVTNVNGAGDAFLAGFTAGLVQGLTVTEAMHCGHKAAAKTIQVASARCEHISPKDISVRGSNPEL